MKMPIVKKNALIYFTISMVILLGIFTADSFGCDNLQCNACQTPYFNWGCNRWECSGCDMACNNCVMATCELKDECKPWINCKMCNFEGVGCYAHYTGCTQSTCYPNQTCCEGGCCDEGLSCHGSGRCCPPEKTTPEKTNYCSNGDVWNCCVPAGCENFNQQKCTPDGYCAPCLYYANSYSELMSCNKVTNPNGLWFEDGCTTPTGDNPANCSYPDNSSFRGACNNHDDCYQTCGSNKGTCDSHFGDDMEAVCAATSFLCHVSCELWRTTYWAAVSICGEGAYEWDQYTIACVCCQCGV